MMRTKTTIMAKIAVDVWSFCIIVSCCLLALPEAAKAYIVRLFEDTNLLSILVGG